MKPTVVGKRVLAAVAAAVLVFACRDAIAGEGDVATPIPVPEIARRAEDAATQLRQTTDEARLSPIVDDIEAKLAPSSERMRLRLDSTARTLGASPSPNALANLAQTWRLSRAELVAWNDALTARGTQLERRLGDLDRMRATWSATRDAAFASRAPAPVLDRVAATAAAIAAARKSIDDERSRVLRLQDRVVRDVAQCDRALADIERARSAAVGPLFARDAAPIWSGLTATLEGTDVARRLGDSVRDDVELARRYLGTQLPGVALQAALFVVVLVLARLARRRARRSAEKATSEETASQVFESPVASAVLFALLMTAWIYRDAPSALVNMVGVLTVVPTVLVVRRLVPRALLPAVWALGAFFLVDRLRDVSASIPPLEHAIFVAELAFGIVFLGTALRSRGFASAAPSGGPVALRALRWIAVTQLAMVSSALVVGALGYERLARLLSAEVIGSTYVALVFYAGLRVAEGLVAWMLRVPPLCDLFVVRNHRELLLRRMHGALRWSCLAVWAYVALDHLTVVNAIRETTSALFAARYVRGAVSLSLGDVVAFALTIVAAYLVSAFVRFVLQEDVYPRVGLSRGAPLAVSTLIHYAIVVVGFVIAGASLGLDFNRITILAGAFGVGIGLGLQGLVANCSSGLILLLERRINVGDAVQMGALVGTVREIGFRASTIRTADGAEVLVPNNSLTSERVINWTLSDRMRQVTLPIAVAYSADPARVVEILRAVAAAHPKALRVPAPVALCVGFGDHAVHVELRVWTASFEEAESLRSELAIAAHAALRDAGVEPVATAERRGTMTEEALARTFAVMVLSVALAVGVTGCASVRGAASTHVVVAAGDEAQDEQNDPWQRFNATTFEFNRRVDHYAMKPVARGWNAVVPERVELMLSNAFDNLGAVPRVVNNALQAKWAGAGREVGRFVINSTVGVAGVFDPAKDVLAIEKSPADFGQTLGKWGSGPGPYLVLPFMEPLTVRDGVGKAVDTALDPLTYVLPLLPVRFSLTAGSKVNDRALNDDAYEAFEDGAIDLYSAVRDGYLQRREHLLGE